MMVDHVRCFREKYFNALSLVVSRNLLSRQIGATLHGRVHISSKRSPTPRTAAVNRVARGDRLHCNMCVCVCMFLQVFFFYREARVSSSINSTVPSHTRLRPRWEPPPPDAFFFISFFVLFSCEQEYVSLKTYDMVASSKGELERTRR